MLTKAIFYLIKNIVKNSNIITISNSFFLNVFYACENNNKKIQTYIKIIYVIM